MAYDIAHAHHSLPLNLRISSEQAAIGQSVKTFGTFAKCNQLHADGVQFLHPFI